MKKIVISIAGILLIGVSSCSKGTVSVVSEQSNSGKSEYNEAAAVNLYNSKCGTCHALQPREKYSANRWKQIVPEMAKKAKLDANQEALILNYVLASPKQ